MVELLAEEKKICRLRVLSVVGDELPRWIAVGVGMKQSELRADWCGKRSLNYCDWVAATKKITNFLKILKNASKMTILRLVFFIFSKKIIKIFIKFKKKFIKIVFFFSFFSKKMKNCKKVVKNCRKFCENFVQISCNFWQAAVSGLTLFPPNYIVFKMPLPGHSVGPLHTRPDAKKFFFFEKKFFFCRQT